jgi:hypothetical protein
LRALLLAVSAAGAATAYCVSLLEWSAKRAAYLALPRVVDASEYHGGGERPWAPGGLPFVGERGIRVLVTLPQEMREIEMAEQLFPEADIRQGAYFGGVLVGR